MATSFKKTYARSPKVNPKPKQNAGLFVFGVISTLIAVGIFLSS